MEKVERAVALPTFDVRLIPEFSGKNDLSVSEWFDKMSWICKLYGVDNVAAVIPLRLCGLAYRVYEQLSEENKLNIEVVQKALVKAFELDAYAAYDQLVSRRLQAGEPVDVYIADIRRLAKLSGGLQEAAVGSAFVHGLPENVRKMLRANARAAEMSVLQLVECARGILSDGDTEPAAAALDQKNEYRDTRQTAYGRHRRKREFTGCCYRCGERGHISANCPGNAVREEL